jgi:serine phosphatase RsbU (regulator of sigma subunit)
MGEEGKFTRFDGLLTAAQRLLFPRERAGDQPGVGKARAEERHGGRWVSKLFVVSAALALLASFVYIFYLYATTAPRIAGDPAVTNLAQPTFEARLAFGQSPLCGAMECWLKPDFDDSGWERVGLPKLEIRKVPGYDEGLKAGHVYYRMRVAVPEHLKQGDKVVSFSFGAINHKRFEIWLNGRLVHEGQWITAADAATTITLPRRDLLLGDPAIVIKATLTGNDVGILHSRGMLVGPKTVLDAIYVTFERTSITYYLLIFFAKGSVFVIFALVYLYTRAPHGFLNFLLYSLFITLENVFIMNVGVLEYDARVMLYFLAKTTAIYCLLRFFVQHYRVYRARAPLGIAGGVMLLTSIGMAFDHGWGSKTVTVPGLFGTTDAMLLATLAFGVSVGSLHLLLLRRNHVAGQHVRVHQSFLVFVAVYAALVVVDRLTNTMVGLDKRMILDLFFFFYMALANARATGLNEGRIVTLEAHFEEKIRMEQELQEAALISRALLPSEVPHWAFCDIAVFHRSITESSGDWFAFERSPDGKLFHCILCDITGHGVQAAIIVSTCKAVLSGLALDAQEAMNRPDFLLRYAERLSQMLFHHGAGLHTATFLGVSFEPEERKLHYVIGGHPLPYKVEKGQVRALANRGNVIGVKEKPELLLKTEVFQSGDEFITFTDGVPLSSNIRVLRKFIQERGAAMSKAAPQELYDAIWREHSLKTAKKPDDDISIIWFKVA